MIVPGAVGVVGRRNRGRRWWGGSVRRESLGFLRVAFGHLKMPPLIEVKTVLQFRFSS